MLGKLRTGKTVGGQEAAKFIKQIKHHLPGCVKQVHVRADSEFFSWESIEALHQENYHFTIAAKSCKPPFEAGGWYRVRKSDDIEYNSCIYAPMGWDYDNLFVAMRIPKHKKGSSGEAVQCELFEDDRYTYRIFCTSKLQKPHKVIQGYDKRADVENLIGESKREGLEAIPSAKFKNNYAWFQLVMLAYNIWRYMKMLAQVSIAEKYNAEQTAVRVLEDIQDNTIRIGRLKLLYLAAKTPYHNNRTKVRYSVHDTRTPAIMHLLKYIDEGRKKTQAWLNGAWRCRFALNTV